MNATWGGGGRTCTLEPATRCTVHAAAVATAAHPPPLGTLRVCHVGYGAGDAAEDAVVDTRWATGGQQARELVQKRLVAPHAATRMQARTQAATRVLHDSEMKASKQHKQLMSIQLAVERMQRGSSTVYSSVCTPLHSPQRSIYVVITPLPLTCFSPAHSNASSGVPCAIAASRVAALTCTHIAWPVDSMRLAVLIVSPK
jgi:hypothetical protein